MKKIAALNILILILITSARSQTIDTSFISDCRILHDKGQLVEARDCYLEHDTNIYAIYGAAVVSKQLDDFKTLKKLTKKLISKKVRTPASFKLCAELYAEDSMKYIQILDKGLRAFENDTLLLTQKTNYYLDNGDFEQAIKLIDDLVLYKNGDNKTLFFAKGFAYEMLDDNENALNNYKKAVEIDSNYFEAYFNIAVSYYNQAVKLYDLANNELNNQAYSKLKSKAEDELAKSLPYMEKANQIRPNDLTVLKALKTIYYRLDDDMLHDIERQIEEIEKD